MKTQRIYARHHAGLILAIASLISAGALMPGTAKVASAQTVYPSWSYTGNLMEPRQYHTATLLRNGQVLVAGSGWLRFLAERLEQPRAEQPSRHGLFIRYLF